MAALFDSDPEVVGQKIGDLTVHDSNQMEEVVRSQHIKIAMLTVPARAAQAVADQLVKAGVRAILNYAPITLSVPANVHVQYVDPVIFLQRMTYFID